MTISKKVQFTVHKTKDIIIELRYPHDHSKGVFWSYEDGVQTQDLSILSLKQSKTLNCIQHMEQRLRIYYSRTVDQ